MQSEGKEIIVVCCRRIEMKEIDENDYSSRELSSK